MSWDGLAQTFQVLGAAIAAYLKAVPLAAGSPPAPP